MAARLSRDPQWAENGPSAQSVRAIRNPVADFGLAEGAETEKQLAWLREAGCTEMQGYLFSRTVPASEIAGLLSSRRISRPADQYLLTA